MTVGTVFALNGIQIFVNIECRNLNLKTWKFCIDIENTNLMRLNRSDFLVRLLFFVKLAKIAFPLMTSFSQICKMLSKIKLFTSGTIDSR